MGTSYRYSTVWSNTNIFYLVLKKHMIWTWHKIYFLGRQSLDSGVRMVCERLAANLSKGIPLTKHDIQQLDSIDDKH